MILVAGIIAPVFALVLIGAAIQRWRLIRPAGMRGLNDLVFYLALPCTLFVSVAEAERLNTLDVAAVFFAGCLFVFAVGLVTAKLWGRVGLAQATIVGVNGCYGNTVMLGVPIVGAALGTEGVATMMPIVALHSVLLLPLATVLIELDGSKSASPWRALRGTLPAVFRNPIIVSIMLAFVWRLAGIPVPGPLHRLLAMLGSCGPTLALICLGASLPGVSLRSAARESIVAAVLKLVAMPLLVGGLARMAGFGPVPTLVAVLVAGMPTGANAFLLARRTATLAEASAGTVALTTALSIVTLSAALIWGR